MDTVTIIPAYASGTVPLIETYLACMERHDAGCPYMIKIYTDRNGEAEIKELCEKRGVQLFGVDVPAEMTGTPKHACLLDTAMKEEDGLVVTMDSDCLPVADGWLSHLVGLHEQGVALPGICWPWKPPDDVPRDTMEWRIRKRHNWTNTWVACQLVDASWVKEHNLRYIGGDDTGFELAEKAEALGLEMKGWMATRCALPSNRAEELDPEFNRAMCVVYGDMMLHIGGASGRAYGKLTDPAGFYDDAVDRILSSRDADWIMEDGNNHEYKYNREEEVAQFKMRVMYREMVNYLKTHDRLFDPPGFRKE